MVKESILVTGAAGFIGGHLCEYLLQQGTSTLGVDNVNDYYDPKISLREGISKTVVWYDETY